MYYPHTCLTTPTTARSARASRPPCLSFLTTRNTPFLHNIQVPLTSLAVPLPQLIVFLHLFYVSSHPTTAPNTTTAAAAAAAVRPGNSDAASSSASPLLLWLDSCHGDPWIWMAVAVVPGFVVALVWYLRLIRSGSIKVRRRRREGERVWGEERVRRDGGNRQWREGENGGCEESEKRSTW